MDKPTMKQEVAVTYVGGGMISFYSTQEAADDFASFGFVSPSISGGNPYMLFVDMRYDVAEVAEYIRNYSKQQPDPPEWLE